MLIEQLSPETAGKCNPPSWTNSKNVSLRAWTSMVEIFEAKKEKILQSNDRAGISLKREYQITQKEIAESVNCHPSTLHNRQFSKGFQSLLSELNEELVRLRNDRSNRLRKVGLKDRRKSEILEEAKRLARDLETQQQLDTKEIVEEVFTRLPLKVRRVLMLE